MASAWVKVTQTVRDGSRRTTETITKKCEVFHPAISKRILARLRRQAMRELRERKA